MRDGFYVGRTITVFHKKALVVFQSVGRTDDSIVQTICMKVLKGFAHPLLEISGCDDLQIILRVKPLLE